MIDFKLQQPQPLKIVDYHIEMLSVGAADSFIIYYIDSKGNHKLILVDAGTYNDGQNIINHIRKWYPNHVIDLAIVTHPDDDHFGGFVKMLEKIKDTEGDAIPIKQFWLNNPQNHVKVTQVQNEIKKTTLANRVARLFDQGERNLLDLIESLRIPISDKFAQPIFCKDMVTGKIVAKPSKERDFLGLTIIGPTRGYFEKLAPNMRYDNLKGYSYDAKDDDEAFKPTATCLSKALDDANDDGSVHNQSSLIFMFEPEKGKKYLFMGDAG
ncbi:MAG TPA: MBL fold metallo-hydrolase, partial [Prevotella sp.]|nr:MBL fold metallo-hydrolase [Prevotella sp.]